MIRPGDEIVSRNDAFGVVGASWTQTSLDLPIGLSFDAWENVGWALGRVRDMSAWGLGEWLIYGEARYGERFAQALKATGRSETTLMELGRVSRKVPRSNRRAGLSWTHHQLVAARDPDEQAEWLAKAEANGWSTEEFRGMLRPAAALPTRRAASLPKAELLELVVDEDDTDDILGTGRSASRAVGEVRERVEDVARAVLRGVEPLGEGYVRLSTDLLDRLANALGETR